MRRSRRELERVVETIEQSKQAQRELVICACSVERRDDCDCFSDRDCTPGVGVDSPDACGEPGCVMCTSVLDDGGDA